MSISLRQIKNTIFPALYVRFLVDEKISKDDYQKLLSLAVVFLNSDDYRVKRLGYRIIVIYSNRTGDYAPLYEVTINMGLYPVAKFIDLKHVEEDRKTFYTELNAAFLEGFKEGNVYCSEQQYLLKKFYEESKNETISVVAPTSYGKTELILNTLRECNNRSVCIITPTKSLLAQTRRRILQAKIPGIKKVVVHPEMYNPSDKFCVAVLTQERLLRLLKNYPGLSFPFVIVDEAHNLLESTRRDELLASVIVLLNKRNPQTSFKFLTPFVSNTSNLKVRYTTYDLTSYEISEYVKTEKIFLYDIRHKTGLSLYDQFVDTWAKCPAEPTNQTSVQFIKNHCASKNIIYFNKPIDIEAFAEKLSANLPDIEMEPELKKAIEDISAYIHPEYNIVKCLKKGVIYHHASVPDLIRGYIEYLYSKIAQIRFVITSSTLLEGVNIPAQKLFIMDNRKGPSRLSPSAFRNLIGRICRFSEILNQEQGTLEGLEPEIYFVFDTYFSRNANVKSFVSSVMRVDKEIHDSADNILLQNKDISQENLAELDRAKEYLENYEPGTIENYQERHVRTKVGKSCVQNNLLEIDVFENEQQIQKMLNSAKYKNVISDSNTLIDYIYDLFIPFVIQNEANSNLQRFRYTATQNYYKMFLSWKLKATSFSQMVMHTVSYWKKLISNRDDTVVYVGKWGDTIHKDANSHRELWVDVSKKTHSQLINLAVVRIKEEQDFVDNTIMKFVEVLNDLGRMDQELYLKMKYGSTDKREIVLIKNGVSLSLTKLLLEKYISYVTVDSSSDTISLSQELISEMRKNKENHILTYEAEMNTF